jgi:hypothetical protein
MAWTPARIEAACDRWHCPPVCQGQIVVVEYGYDSGGSGDAFRRVTDRSEGPNAKPSYAYSRLPEAKDEWEDAWNEPLSGKWVEVQS